MRRIVFLGILVLAGAVGAQAQAPNTITTIVGGGTNSGAATGAYIPGPAGVAHDNNGNTYISSGGLNIVYKVTSAGQISAYAGNGIAGFSGDGQAATGAQLNFPQGLAVDANNNLFIADSNNNRIRRVDAATGVITTVAGSGNQYNGVGFFGGYSGDGGPATSALMNFPAAVAVDSNENLFIADTNNDVIRMVDNSPTHIISTYAGNGTPGTIGSPNGDGGPAINAQLNIESGLGAVAVDSKGNLYIADAQDSVVRIVDTSPSHIINTFAGNITKTFTFSGDNGPANQAGLNFPLGVSVDANDNVFIEDNGNQRVRKVDNTANHIITTVAGNGNVCLSFVVGCGDGGSPTSALLNGPVASASDALGNLFIADFGTNRIRMVAAGGTPTISTFAGGGTGGDGGVGTNAVVSEPFTIATDTSGNVFFPEQYGNRIRKWDATAKTVTTVAGNGIQGYAGDNGPATQANIFGPVGIALNGAGDLFIDDPNVHVVRRVDHASNTITTFAGTGATCNTTTVPGCGDGGPATSATFRRPFGVAVDSKGNVYISDSRSQRIRKVDTSGTITNFAGTGAKCVWTPASPCGDGGAAASASFNFPQGLAIDAQDNLYVADALNNVVRKISATTLVISTIAFNGQPTFGGDSGNALSASMQVPEQVGVDPPTGALIVGGGIDNVVRRVDANDQSIITIAGDIHNLDGGFNGDGIPSTQALLSNFGVAVDGNHNVFIGDAGNGRVRVVHMAPVAAVSSLLQPFGPVLPGDLSSPDLVTITNNGLDDLTVTGASVPAGFTLTNFCQNPATLLPIPVSPLAGSCLLEVAFTPPVGATNGMVFGGNLTFNTNDPAHPSLTFALSGTAVTTAETLTLNFGGTGTGTISGSSEGLVNGVPTLIACTNATSPCPFNFALGQQVTLFAVGNAGSAFTGWNVNGSTTTCPATTPACTVTMSAVQNVTASFGPASVSVAGMGNGSGHIASSPAGIDCTVTNGVANGPTCTFSGFPAGTQNVTLTATAAADGSRFSGWLGLCGLIGSNGLNTAGTGPCALPLSIAGVTALNGALATAVFSGPSHRLVQGDVFVGTVDGMIFEFNPSAPGGTLVQVLNSGTLGGIIAGMNFDTGGNLYAANPQATNTGPNPGTVEFFMNTGAGPSFDFGLFNSSPTGVLVAPSGDVFVGQSAGQNTLLQFSNAFNGTPPTNTFFPAYDNAGIGYLELLDDGASVLYSTQSAGSSQTGTVKNFDILNNHQNPDFATGLTGGPAFAIRELPDKTVLIANTTQIVRLNPNGTPMGAPSPYKPGGGGLFYALNLNPDGLSFWTGDALSGKVFQVRISDGTVLNTINTGLGFNSQALSFNTIFGIAVLGQPASGGADLAVTVSAPTADAVNTQMTYTATVTNNGPLAAAGVSLTDTFPANVSVNSAVSSQGPCTVGQTVTCTVGTMNSSAVVTITINVTPTQTMTLNNTVAANATTPDPIPGNNAFTTSTQVSGPALATISLFAPGYVELGTSLTYTMVVTNPGGTTLAGISAQLSVPPVLGAPSSVSPGCSPTTLICTIGTLTPGQVAAVDLTFVPTGLTNLNSGATVTGGNVANATTVVISNGVPLVLELDSVNSADFITTSPSSGICTTAQVICTAYFPPGTMVTVTANGPGFLAWSVNNSSTTCPGTGTCTVTLSSPQQVIPVYSSVGFVIPQLTGVLGIPFGVDLSSAVGGGVPPYTIALTGTLPSGLTFTTPSISGIPTATGMTQLTVNITDSIGEKGSTPVTLTINNPPSGQEALANGNYAILFHMVNDADGSLFAVAGSLHFNGKGIIDSGTLDTNGNGAGQVPQTLSVTGTYTIGPDHRCLIKLQNVGKSVAVIACSVGDVYQGIAHTAHIIEFDDNTGTGLRGAGIAKLQDSTAFTAASLAGTYIIGATGQNPSHNRVTEVGVGSVNATGAITSATDDFNNNGTLSTETLVSGTYGTDGSNGAISPVGRTQYHVMLNNSISGMITSDQAVYIVDANTLFSLKINSGATNSILAATRERQMNPGTFTAASLSGPDAVAKQGPANSGNGSNVFIGVATFTAAAGPNPTTGTIVVTKDVNNAGAITLEGSENDTYTIAINGRFVTTIPGIANQPIGYLSRPDHGFTMDTTADPRFGTIDLQAGAPFTVPALPTDYFFGDREPGSTMRGEDVSGVISLSNNVASATFDQSHQDGRLDYAQSGSFGISLASTGRLVLTRNPSNLLVTNDEIGQVITPSHIVFSEFDPSQTHPTLHEEQSFLMPAGLPSPNPANVNFPVPVAIGSNAVMTLTFTNASDGLLSFTGIINATDFSVSSGSCVTGLPVVVLAHTTCTAVITLAPQPSTPAGPISEGLTLQTDAGNVTITATGTVAAQSTTTHFAVSAPAAATAGTAFNFTVTAQDASNNTVTGYSGTVHFTSTDGAAVLPANSTLTNGVGNFSATLKTAGSQTITATDAVTSSITGTSGNITVNPATATHFAVSAPAAATAGSAFNFTVTAQDQFNNTATGYSGTVHFTSSDGAAVVPANSTLTSGVGNFSATLKTTGPQTITATDTVTASITGTSAATTVSAGPATHFLVSAPAAATAGTAFNFTVTALDVANNTATSYGGTVHFTSSDGAAVLPANSALTNGVGNFSATLKTAGSRTVTATDTVAATVTGTSAGITVNPAAAVRFLVGAPAAATAGSAFNFTVTAQDQFNNTATGYTGTVHFTSSDGAAILPANSTLTNGAGNFSATLKTAGLATVTATDTVTTSITGTSSGIAVNAATATHLAVSAPGNVSSGTAFNFTVTAQDQFNNTATGYTGTVHFTSSDGAAILPANSTLTNGTRSFSATLNTGGSQTITATDTVTSSITGVSGAITVAVTGADIAVVKTGPANAAVGQTIGYTVKVTNNGPQDATGVAMSDPIPAGLQPTQVSGPPGCIVQIQQSVTQYTIFCNIGALANGASATITYNITPVATGTLTNTATAGTANQSDPNPNNNSSAVTTTVSTSGPPTLQSIAVTPANPTIAVTNTQQFTATGTYSDNSQQNLTTSVTWASSQPTVAQVSNISGSQGLASSLTSGSTTISATFQGVAGSTTLTVTGPLLVADWNVSAEGPDDKQRIDGKSPPLVIGLKNSSSTQTLHITGVSADNPAFTVTTTCATLGPGQTCTVSASFAATSVCQLQTSILTVADDDPSGNLQMEVDGHGADNGLQVVDMTNPAVTALSLAQKLVGPGVTISNVTYTGAPRAAGTFTSSSNIIGFTDGVVLSSGSVRNVVGPNCSSGISVDNGEPGDPDLDKLLGVGQATNDAAVLEFDIMPSSPSISFQYVFGSDEYNEFVYDFNDVFGFFFGPKGGSLQNIALIPGTNLPVSINNVNGGNPLGTNPTNPQFYTNNDFQVPLAAPVDTEMDGLTVVLTATAQVVPGNTYHIKLGIADASDFALDSNVFIKAGSLTSSAVTLTPPSLAFGNQAVGTQSGSQTVTLANAGATTVNIASIVASTGFTTTTCPGTLAPAGQNGSTCVLNIAFAPQTPGDFAGTLTVTDDSPVPNSTQVVTLSGTGTSAGPTLVSITVAPPSASIAAGTTQAFTATGHFSDESSGPVSVTWSSGNTAIATVNSSTGVATGVKAGGPVNITATSAQTPNISGTAQLTVTAPALVSIAVTPANPTVVVGQQQQFTATGTFSDNSKQDLTAQVVWASSNTEAATISEGGLATALTGGENTTISATFTQGNTNIVGSTVLTVTTVPFVLTITPPPGGNPGAPPTVSPGGQLVIGMTLTATPGFTGTVTFSCVSDKPQFLTCVPAPASVTLSGNTPKQVAIVMNTFCQGDVPLPVPAPGGIGGGLQLLLAAGILASVLLAYRKRSRWALSFAVLMLIALGSAACSSLPSGTNGRTPAGTYTLSITASAKGTSQTVQVPIQVTP